MTYELYLGDPTYSSWSLRGWLLFERFNLPVKTIWVDFNTAPVAEQMDEAPPATTVPTLRAGDGAIVWDSLAIAEELATRHPDAGHWPSDPAARATARSLAAEMHSGFTALRNDCPMNLRTAYSDVPASEAVQSELRRLEKIWSFAREAFGGDNTWLCGAYSVADAFFAPIAARIAGYGLDVSGGARDYVDAHLADPAFRRWRAMGIARGATLARYDKPFAQTGWPGPAPLRARAVSEGTAENSECPYSGKAITALAEIDGRILGYCNRFCRDKTVADPAAWPKTMALLDN